MNDSEAVDLDHVEQALSIDFDRLRELLGETELRRLLDAEVVADHELSLQRRSRPVFQLDAMHDLLLAIGDLSQETTVNARAAAIDSTTSTVGALIPAQGLAELPLITAISLAQ